MAKKSTTHTSSTSKSPSLPAISSEKDIELFAEIKKRYCAQTPELQKALDAALVFFLIKGIVVLLYGFLTRTEFRTFLGGFLPPVAMFVLVMFIRNTSEKEREEKMFQILGALFCAALVFFLAIVNFIY